MGWDNAMRTGRGRMRVMASSLNTELGQARPRPPAGPGLPAPCNRDT